ncbi:hypothetical protein DPMN_011121 [Dreissena polymorpha]|uniref:Uncharacterized protein n=1 Tax=Dreissena polymorpha TaxID=45954 RepID=A0A9D4N306_DREPO|nr:hypothetical protein DPMN_011121 [Dreissena polymorpha]
MWTDRQRTKTNPKTSPEQSAIFQLVQEINKTNAKNVTSIVKTAPPPGSHFHDDWAKNKTAPPPGSHVIQLTGTIFQLNSCIKETIVLTKFHENWAKNVTSRVFTCFHYIHIEKNAPPTGGHVFSPIPTIFKTLFTRENCHYIHIEKNVPPTGSHVFSPISTILELIRDIN